MFHIGNSKRPLVNLIRVWVYCNMCLWSKHFKGEFSKPFSYFINPDIRAVPLERLDPLNIITALAYFMPPPPVAMMVGLKIWTKHYILSCHVVLYLYYCIVLYCIVLWCFVLYINVCLVLSCIVLYCTVLYYIVLHCIVLYYIALHCYCIILYCTVLYCVALYCCTVLHCIVLYCIVLH